MVSDSFLILGLCSSVSIRLDGFIYPSDTISARFRLDNRHSVMLCECFLLDPPGRRLKEFFFMHSQIFFQILLLLVSLSAAIFFFLNLVAYAQRSEHIPLLRLLRVLRKTWSFVLVS